MLRRARAGGRRAAVPRRARAAEPGQDAHDIRHQHAQRLLRAATRRRGLLPASGITASSDASPRICTELSGGSATSVGF
ncbi:unnamed protein product [Urochloa humidicola]